MSLRPRTPFARTRFPLLALAPLVLALHAAPAQERAELGTEQLDRVAEDLVLLVAAGIDGDPEATGERIWTHFAPELARAVPPDKVEALFGELAGDGPVEVRLLIREPLDGGEADDPVRHWRHELTQGDSAWISDLTLDRSGAATGWLLRPGAPWRTRSELTAAARELGGEWGLALRLLDAGGAEVETFTDGSGVELLPMGSAFKLYVLAELAAQASAGEVDLDGTLPIREEAKSLPSGTMHTLEAGTPVSVREMARQMIAISDNTATDHLIELLGRERIEAHLERYGNTRPDELRPFLRTIDMFLIKGIGAKVRASVFAEGDLGEVAAAWAAAGPDRRRAWLDDLWAAALDGRDHAKVRAQAFARYTLATMGAGEHHRIEWNVRPLDMVELLTRAHRGTLVDAEASRTFLDVYAAGPPQYLQPGVAEQGFKGGSETGVLALTVRVSMEDGRAVLACLARTGVSALDPGDSVRTVALLGSWVRNLLEGDPPRPEGQK